MAATSTTRSDSMPVPGGQVYFDGRPAELAARLLEVLEGERR